jgi:tetratricopeptide (TPR) repeat protein
VALRPAARSRPLAAGAPAIGVTAAAAVLLALSLAGPWFAQRYTDQALVLWRVDQEKAFDKLDRARSLNPLSSTPDVAGGSIAIELDETAEAEARFRAALERNPGDAHSHLRYGALAYNAGRRGEGIGHLRTAVLLNRRDEIVRRALRRARRGRVIDIKAMNEAIAERYRELGE